jgi:hypothetical protein
VKIAITSLLLLALVAQPAGANPFALYVSGKYDQAIADGSRENTSVGLALAARAALADAMLKSPCLECIRRAEELAQKAIVLDPKLADGHVYLAVSLGYHARIIGKIRAQLDSYPQLAKRNLDLALASDPANAWALAARGGWNIEVVRGGGAALARWLYGATLEAGQRDFAAAFRSAPGNLVLRYQYALSLGGLDQDAYRDSIRDALTRASRATPGTAYEEFAQARARELLDALSRDDRGAFERLVRRDQGYP